jgi:hypothetical protein
MLLAQACWRYQIMLVFREPHNLALFSGLWPYAAPAWRGHYDSVGGRMSLYDVRMANASKAAGDIAVCLIRCGEMGN